VKPGQARAAGERLGHIGCGCRTDLYLPSGARLLVGPGQRMCGGETVIAELNAADATPRAAVEF
jgi:phosphatidylserine decarboxylase